MLLGTARDAPAGDYPSVEAPSGTLAKVTREILQAKGSHDLCAAVKRRLSDMGYENVKVNEGRISAIKLEFEDSKKAKTSHAFDLPTRHLVKMEEFFWTVVVARQIATVQRRHNLVCANPPGHKIFLGLKMSDWLSRFDWEVQF